MNTTFLKLNEGWNADPNVPNPSIEVHGEDLLLKFSVNPWKFPEFRKGEIGVLRFVGCQRYRLGPTNDEGWCSGRCRFSKLAPDWGQFYLANGDIGLLDAPGDWRTTHAQRKPGKHFLFYFRDHTFECVAEHCEIELSAVNSLMRTRKELASSPG